MAIGIGTEYGSHYIAFGLADHEAWKAAGATYNLKVGDNDTFDYRIVH